MSLHNFLKTNTLLFDGAMGTYLMGRDRRFGGCCEKANLEAPELVAEIHREYLASGCGAIKTNTFGANRTALGQTLCEQVIAGGWRIATEAGKDAFVFADIGPITTAVPDLLEEYRFVVDQFLKLGAENFLFETHSDIGVLPQVAAYIREKQPDAFIMVSFAPLPDGFTRDGRMASRLLEELDQDPNVDALGLNCVTGARHMVDLVKELGQLQKPLSVMPNAGYPSVVGTRTVYDGSRDGRMASRLLEELDQDPNVDALGLNCVTGARHMVDLVKELGQLQKPLSVMPNAGYPSVVGTRTVYDGSPAYFAGQLSELAGLGAKILGGCCGTTPEHIQLTAEALRREPVRSVPLREKQKQEKPQTPDSFWDDLCDEKKRPFAVELDPPEGADVTKFMAGAKELRDNGAGVITIADCPIARARMDSSLLACKVRRELGMQALPHMTCRDRNLNATKALLLGLSAEDIHNVLVVTGDPIPSASRDEVKSVYNFNSRMLAGYITGLGKTVLPAPFHVFGALNVNARNFRVQLDLALEKEKNGVCGFLTQPVLTEQGLENLKKARETLSGKILGGIIPIVSHRNALFMNSEVAGITVDDRIVDMYQGLDREAGEALAVKISTAVAQEIAPYVDGYYLITPFGRTGLMARIMDAIREQENN